jgi:hypothetical protein
MRRRTGADERGGRLASVGDARFMVSSIRLIARQNADSANHPERNYGLRLLSCAVGNKHS